MKALLVEEVERRQVVMLISTVNPEVITLGRHLKVEMLVIPVGVLEAGIILAQHQKLVGVMVLVHAVWHQAKVVE